MKRAVFAVLLIGFAVVAGAQENSRRLIGPAVASVPSATLVQVVTLEPVPGGMHRTVSMRLAMVDTQGHKTDHDLGTAKSGPAKPKSKPAQIVTGKEAPLFSGKVETRSIERTELPERTLRGVKVRGRRWVDEIPAIPGIFPAPFTETSESWADASGRVLQMKTVRSTGLSHTTDYFAMPIDGVDPAWFTGQEP